MTISRLPKELIDAWDATPAATDDDDATGRTGTETNKTKGKNGKRQAGDRFGVLNAFVDFSLRELTRAETAVWLLLWRDTKGDGLAKTSQADIGRRAGLHIATVKRTVAKLCRRGLLTVVRRGNLRRGPSIYRVRPLTKDYQK